MTMSVVQEYSLVIQWSDEDQLYLAFSPELPGCITHGRTYLEAAEMGVEAMELWCDATEAAGEPLPAPHKYGQDGIPGERVQIAPTIVDPWSYPHPRSAGARDRAPVDG
jgi:predicted RNase H-like HicB family nuclease